jgi:RimJ/RimL family protein N-acetyltransferase
MHKALLMDTQSRYAENITQVPDRIAMRSGETVASRLIRPDDADLLVDFAHSLSPESRRRRFHQSVENLSEKMIRERAGYLADVDNETQGGAVLALAEDENGREQIVGVARLGRLPGKAHDPQAEAAIVVRDDYQGQGIGTELLRRLVLLARQMQVKEMVAYFEGENARAIRLFRALDLPTKIEIEQGETTLLIEMPE